MFEKINELWEWPNNESNIYVERKKVVSYNYISISLLKKIIKYWILIENFDKI